MKKIFALLFISFSVNVFAITDVSGKVARIFPSDNKLFFNLVNDQCGLASDSHYYFFVLDNETKKAWFSIILAAANTGRPINVRLPSCPSASTGMQVEIQYIYQQFN